MGLLHNTLIPFKTRGLLKKGHSSRRSINYRLARRIGLIFSMDNLFVFEAIRSFEHKLKKEGKEVEVISYLPANVENFDFHYDFFTQKDFSFFGNVLAANIEKFVNQPFDLLICLDLAPNVYIEHILAASAAHFRIGPHISEREDLFELMIGIDEKNDVSELINQIYHYTNEL